MTNTDTTVAQNIIAQLGGRRALVMIGATGKNLGFSESGLYLTFGRGITEMSMASIELNAADEYTVKMYKGRGVKLREVSSVDVQADNLRETVERAAKVYLSL